MAEENIPKARIVSVNGKPFDARPRARVVSVENRTVPWVHPLDQQEAREFLVERLPAELYKDLINSPRPALSVRADEIEKAEAEEVKRRRGARLVHSGGHIISDVGSWMTRTLYEETFAVKPAITLGGTLSHHYRQMWASGEDFSPEAISRKLQIIDPNVVNSSFTEFTQLCKQLFDNGQLSTRQFGDLIEDIGTLGVPTNNWSSTFMVQRSMMGKFLEDPTMLASSQLGTHLERGWLFLRSFHLFEEEMLAQITDERVRGEFTVPEGRKQPSTRIEMLLAAWHTLGRPGLAMTEDFTFKRHNEKGYDEGLRKLAVLRASPDLASLYNHFSAIGSINSRQ